MVAVSPDGARAELGRLAHASDIGAERTGWSFAIYLAAEEDLLGFPYQKDSMFRHRPGFQMTSFPCERLWGPGAWDELRHHWQEFERAGDEVQYLDRLFLFRVHEGAVDPPRSVEDFALTQEEPGRWFAVRADDPARGHIVLDSKPPRNSEDVIRRLGPRSDLP